MATNLDKNDNAPPRVFMSYSWDDENHKSWVLQLATRLNSNGINIILDRWDAKLGTDLPLFMEQGLGDADRVLLISSDVYVQKANLVKGGVGYERRIMTADLLRDLSSDKVIPLLRNNVSGELPKFMGSSIYLDFRDDQKYEDKYAELIHNLHGKELLPRPPLGPSPFLAIPEAEVPVELKKDSGRYLSPGNSGVVKFNYSNNSGHYTIGSGDMSFTISTSEAGFGSIYMYRDHSSVKTVALAKDVEEIHDIKVGSSYDSSSRVRTAHIGDSIVLRNRNDYWAVICIDKVETRDSSIDGDELFTFRYAIQPNHSDDFSKLVL